MAMTFSDLATQLQQIYIYNSAEMWDTDPKLSEYDQMGNLN